ncbi:MAG: efflux RND transporter periplasmic adaptor subunit [Gammaproteobacteria bacterium]
MKIFLNLFFLFNLLGIATVAAESDVIAMSQVQMYNLGIKTGKLEPVEQVPFLNAPAKVVIPPSQEYIVSASQAGLINKLLVSIGDQVTKGQILAEINSPELLTLQRQFLKVSSERQLSWAGYQRDKKLLEEGVISNRRWQETLARYNVSASEVSEARQLLEIAGMSEAEIKQLAATRRLSSLLHVHSPIDGVVLERMAVAGKRIDILAPLYRIANLERLWLEIHIPQERISSVKPGGRVLIDNSSATARISLLSQSVNPNNQTVLVRAEIESNQNEVKAGQTVNTRLIQSSEQAVFKVSNSAIAQSEGSSYIFIRNEEGFRIKSVNVIGKEGEDSIISGDLKGDEEIAVRGAVALKANWMGLGSEESEGE